jgi:hypothetical protein
LPAVLVVPLFFSYVSVAHQFLVVPVVVLPCCCNAVLLYCCVGCTAENHVAQVVALLVAMLL